MAANMYRVGDYVFFETSSTTPYQIRRIEELNKTPNGNVEAKVMCFYRRRDISSSLIQLADKHQSVFDRDEDEEEDDEDEEGKSNADLGEAAETGSTTSSTSVKKVEKKESSNGNKETKENSISVNSNCMINKEDLDDKEKHQLKHRELFLSRQVETLPATHIRGKCAVTLLNETEALMSYLNKEDAFFYSLVYDPQQKTLLADKGEIRVGSKYQAQIQKLLKKDEEYTRKSEDLEQLVYSPINGLTDKKIDQFLVLARSVGTFARALDCTSTVRQPSLHMSAAAASRDITLFHAMDILHKHKYNVSNAISSMVPGSGPVLCRDEMEEWSASEANLFEEALDKYGKDFNDIRQDFLPWKSLKSIVEYYYMWKTTDRYVQQKRIKAAEAESKLKQVYIPNYNKPNPAQIQGNMNGAGGGRACESCYTGNSNQWYAWGPVHMQCRLCGNCWSYWKKYGGLKMPTRLDGMRPGPDNRPERLAQMAALQRMHRCTIQGCGKEFRLKAHLARHLATAHGLAIRAGSPRPVMKTRAAFCLITTPLTRISRQICKEILAIRKAARLPFHPINIALIKQECQMQLPKSLNDINPLKPIKRASTNRLATRRGIDITLPLAPFLEHTVPIKEPPRYAFPPRGPEIKIVPAESLERSSPKPTDLSSDQPNLLKKRVFEETNGVDEQPSVKRINTGVIRQAGNVKSLHTPRGTVINQNGKLSSRSQLVKGGKKLSWMDAPDDVYFVATDATRLVNICDPTPMFWFHVTENTRKLRKQMNGQEFRKVARKPWRKLNVKTPFSDPPPAAPAPVAAAAVAAAAGGGGGGSEVVVLD